jgi:hypothetical protein
VPASIWALVLRRSDRRRGSSARGSGPRRSSRRGSGLRAPRRRPPRPGGAGRSRTGHGARGRRRGGRLTVPDQTVASPRDVRRWLCRVGRPLARSHAERRPSMRMPSCVRPVKGRSARFTDGCRSSPDGDPDGHPEGDPDGDRHRMVRSRLPAVFARTTARCARRRRYRHTGLQPSRVPSVQTPCDTVPDHPARRDPAREGPQSRSAPSRRIIPPPLHPGRSRHAPRARCRAPPQQRPTR